MSDSETETVRIFACYEPDQRGCAEALATWPIANGDAERYCARCDADVEDENARDFKEEIRQQMEGADAVVCLISQTAFLEPWITWELETARSLAQRPGLVGVLLNEFNACPEVLKNCGAIFVPFRRDAVERAIEWATTEAETSGDFTLADT